jgi:hypothetical protein
VLWSDPRGNDIFSDTWELLFGSSGESATPLTPGKAATEGFFGKIGKGIGGLFGSGSGYLWPKANVTVEKTDLVPYNPERRENYLRKKRLYEGGGINWSNEVYEAQKLIPVWGSCVIAGECFEQGDYFGYFCWGAVGLFEGLTLGLGAELTVGMKASRATIKLADNLMVEEGVNTAGRQLVKEAVEYETHHLLPKEFREFFENVLKENIDKYTIKLEKGLHRLKKSNGIHTNLGGNWNRVWKEWIAPYKKSETYPSPEQVLEKLNNMRKEFGI